VIGIQSFTVFSDAKDAYERKRGNATKGGKIGKGTEMRVPRVNSTTSSVDLESSLFMY